MEELHGQLREDPAFYIFGPPGCPSGGFVRTFDEKDRTHPRKPFPDLPYLRFVLDYIHSAQMGEVVAIAKSRQMLITWLVSAYISWEAHFHEQARVMIQTENDKKACDVVYRNSWLTGRVAFIERSLPRPVRMYGIKATKGQLLYPQGAVVEALPQGPDPFRSYAASLAIFDEAAYQKQFGESYKAALPMAKGSPNKPGSGGRIVIMSSAKADTEFADLIGQTERKVLRVA